MGTFRIGYFGDGPWSHHAFDRLHADPTISIAFVCARFDAPDPVLRQRASDHGIDFLTHEAINSDEFAGMLAARYPCDLFVSMSFNQIFRKRLIELPRLHTINCHAGKLPFYRGRNILNWALINDESEFGITVHYVDEGVDTGDIVAQRAYPITDADDYRTLLDRAHVDCATILYDAIKQIQAGTATRTAQGSIHPTGFYCSARRPGDERLRWDQDARSVFNFVRAICPPGPSARSTHGTGEMRVHRVRLVPDAPCFKGIPGAVLAVGRNGFHVKTADSFVEVVEWDSPTRVRVGDRLS